MKIKTKMLKKFISILCAATMVVSGAVVSVGASGNEEDADKQMKLLSSKEGKEIKINAKKKILNKNGGKNKESKEIQTKTKNKKKKLEKKETFWEKRARELKAEAEGRDKWYKDQIEKRRKERKIVNDYLNNLKEERLKKQKEKEKSTNQGSTEKEKELLHDKMKRKFEAQQQKWEKEDAEKAMENKLGKMNGIAYLRDPRNKKKQPAKSEEEKLLEEATFKCEAIDAWKAELDEKCYSEPQRALIRGALVRLDTVGKRTKKSVAEEMRNRIEQQQQLEAQINELNKKIASQNVRENHYSSQINRLEQIKSQVSELAKSIDYKSKESMDYTFNQLKIIAYNIFNRPIIDDNLTSEDLGRCFESAFGAINLSIGMDGHALTAAQKEIEKLEQEKMTKESELKKGYDRLKDLDSIIYNELIELKRRIGKLGESEARREEWRINKENARKANNNYQYMNYEESEGNDMGNMNMNNEENGEEFEEEMEQENFEQNKNNEKYPNENEEEVEQVNYEEQEGDLEGEGEEQYAEEQENYDDWDDEGFEENNNMNNDYYIINNNNNYPNYMNQNMNLYDQNMNNMGNYTFSNMGNDMNNNMENKMNNTWA